MATKVLLVSVCLATGISIFDVRAETDGADGLFSTIHGLDSQLFDAFNKCASPAELARHAAFFSSDTEFYHDNGGVTWSREAMIANTRKYACGNYTRELVENTFKVSPISGYGAISSGVHRFCQNATKECSGEADFVMVWRDTSGKWEVTRSLSFGHRESKADSGGSTALDARAMEGILQEHGIASVSIAVIDGGKLVSTSAFGEASKGVSALPETYYNIASMAKPISAEVAMQLVALGKISLDENMSKYWIDPDIAVDPRRNQLTPRIALAHETGFPNWRAGVLRFERDPGQSFGYSGEGYEYLARFIRNKTGKSIDVWAEQLVFAPNGMRNTTYTNQPWLEGRIALPHDEKGIELAPQLRDAAIASDDVFSTASDYAHFMIGVMDGRGLAPALRTKQAEVLADRKAELCSKLVQAECPTEAGMGLGWESFLIDGKRYLMHTGADAGTFTFGYFSPDTRSGVVVLTNSSNGAKAVLPVLRLIGKDEAFVDFLQRLVEPRP